MKRVGIAVIVASVMLVAPVAARAHVKTVAKIFYPWTNNATPALANRTETGFCGSGSQAADRYDAWRCYFLAPRSTVRPDTLS